MAGAEASAPASRLRVAAAVVVLQCLGELVAVAGRTDLVVGFRVMLMLILALQLLFARGILRRGAGSVLGLFTFELMAVIAAIGSRAHWLLRSGLAVSAVGVIVLLAMSLDQFPTVAPPPSHPTSR